MLQWLHELEDFWLIGGLKIFLQAQSTMSGALRA